MLVQNRTSNKVNALCTLQIQLTYTTTTTNYYNYILYVAYCYIYCIAEFLCLNIHGTYLQNYFFTRIHINSRKQTRRPYNCSALIIQDHFSFQVCRLLPNRQICKIKYKLCFILCVFVFPAYKKWHNMMGGHDFSI